MKMRKILTMVGALALTAALAIGGTLAYLTANQSVTNTFTVGHIEMTLDEKNVSDPTGNRVSANTYDIIPGDKLEKDPTVHVLRGSEKCYVYIQIEDELNSTVSGSAVYQLTSDWTVVDEANKIYKYNSVVDASTAQQNLVVFTADENGKTVTIDGSVVNEQNMPSLNGKTIVVNAYAHQSENVEESVARAAAIAHFTPASPAA